MRPTTFDDYRQVARAHLPRFLFHYIDGASFAEETAHRNVADLQRLSFRQKVLRNVASVGTRCSLFGEDLDFPVVLGPVGLAGMYARRGEVQAARAAAKAGIPFCLSSLGVCSIGEVAAHSTRPIWMQLYLLRDRTVMAQLLATAHDSGCRVLLFTVDLPVAGVRYRELRAGMVGRASTTQRMRAAFDVACHPGWLWDVFTRGRPHTLGTLAAAGVPMGTLAEAWDWVRQNMDPTLTWNDIEWLRQHWPGRLVIKGLLDVEDAREAARVGVDGIVVSNHGGRQLDSTPSTISMLPDIVDAVGDRLSVLIDSGFRSGLDVLKARALGARACLLGRAWAFALAAGGEHYVTEMLSTLRREIEIGLMLTGCTDIEAADRRILAS